MRTLHGNDEDLSKIKFSDHSPNNGFQTTEELHSENFKILFDQSPYASIIHDGSILKYANEAAVKLLNYDCIEEIIGRSLKSFIHSKDWDISEKWIKSLQNINSSVIHCECQIITKDNRAIYTKITSDTCLFYNKRVIHSILLDISECKKTEKAHWQDKQRLKDLTEAAFEGIAVSENGIIRDVNQQLLDMLNTKQERVIGKHIFQFLDDESHESIIKRMNIEGSFEINIKKNDGTSFPAEIRARKEKVDGKLILIFVIRDISEEKQLQAKIYKAIIEAEERERGRFSSDLHDGIGPMLTILKVYFDWLADTPHGKKHDKIAEKGRQYFNEAIQTLEEISNRLSPRKVHKLGLILALEDFILKLNETNKIKIDFNTNSNSRFHNNIEISLYKIISELINNTLKHAEAKKIIINLRYEKIQNKLILNYNDNGKGCILNDELKNSKGFGLMNIIQRVQSLDGKICMHSEKGLGFKVIVEIILNIEHS